MIDGPIIRRRLSRTSAVRRPGQSPPPEVLAGYQAIDTTLVDRIFTIAETNMSRQHQLDVAALEAKVTDRRAYRIEIRFGQCFAFGVAVIGLIGSVLVTVHGSPVTGSIRGGGTLV